MQKGGLNRGKVGEGWRGCWRGGHVGGDGDGDGGSLKGEEGVE